MRATMFGHDVHRFDLEAYMAANATPPLGNATAPAGTIPPLDDPSYRRSEPARQPYETRTPYEARHHVDGVPRPAGAGAQSGPSQLADFLRRQAERPNPAALRMSSLDDTDSYAAPRVPMSARIVLVAGLAALTAAVVFWIRSRSNADLNVMPPGPAPAIGSERLPARAIDPVQERRALDAARRAVQPAAPATAPAPPRAPAEAAKPVIPPLPAALVKEVSAARRASSAEIAPVKAVRRARVAPTSRPSTDAQTEAPVDLPVNAADEKTAGTPDDQAASPPARIEAPVPPAPVEKVRERRATGREREKRAVEKDNDATLPPSAE
jgi:hypothetical protein